MTERLSTSLAEAVSAEFTPSGEFALQCNATSTGVTVDVYAKVDASAPFVIVDSFAPALEPLRRYVQFAAVKVGLRGNAPGTTVKVWSA